MKKIILFTLFFFLLIYWSFSFWQRFDDELWDSVWSLEWTLDRWPSWDSIWRDEARDFLIYIWTNILTPLIIVIWVIIAIVWIYKIMFTTGDEDQKKWVNYIIRGVVGILVMTSASFITQTLLWQRWWELIDDISWRDLASTLYNDIIFPFFRIFAYLIVWILFVILLIQAFKMLTTNQDETAKNAKTIFIRNIIWILVILFSSQIVQLIYWRWEEWIDSAWEVGAIWWAIFEDPSTLEFVITIINWFMWFIAFIVLAIIIYQTYLLLVKPDDEETSKKLRKNFVYIFIWVLVIWAWFLITNFLIIN